MLALGRMNIPTSPPASASPGASSAIMTQAKFWHESALRDDPVHVGNLSYYGMLHAEQGNVLKAEDFLRKISMICGGNDCEPYKNPRGLIEGKFTY